MYKLSYMKASMGTKVKEALSNTDTAKVLTAAIIANGRFSDVITVSGALRNGQVLTLKRVSIKDR